MRTLLTEVLLFILSLFLCVSLALSQPYQEARVNTLILGGGVPAAGGGTENIGYETNGGSQYNHTSTYVVCFKCLEQPTQNGSVDSITMTFDGNDSIRYFKMAIYTHDAVNDLPDSLLANSVTDELDVTSSSPTDKSFNYVTKPSVTAGTTYWLCHHAKTDYYIDVYYDSVGGSKFALKTGSYDTWPAYEGTTDYSDTLRLGKGYFVNSY